MKQPGSLCRLIKLVASKHTSSQIFLDSDQLEDLDLIFDTIRCKTHSVVVVLTPQVLTRMWCAGEIVTAFKNRILTVPLLCDGYTPPDVELLDHLEEIWTGQQKQILSVHGISLEDVRSAYVWLDAWCESEVTIPAGCFLFRNFHPLWNPGNFTRYPTNHQVSNQSFGRVETDRVCHLRPLKSPLRWSEIRCFCSVSNQWMRWKTPWWNCYKKRRSGFLVL